MQLESQISWEKLSVELELLSSEDTTTLMQLVLDLNGWLWPEGSMEPAARALNFMTYELMAQCQGLNELERLNHLNHYYFERKGFQVLDIKPSEVQERHLLPKPVLEQRAGSPIAIALFYLHFASHIDLPAYLIQMRNHYLLKWVRGGQVHYVDLCAEGRLLSEEDLMQIVARVADQSSLGAEALNVLPNRKTFLRYASELVRIYERTGLHEQLHSMFNVMLKIEPQNSKLLGRRALLRRQLGLEKEALSDLKRYFSFVEESQAPPEMIQALHDLH